MQAEAEVHDTPVSRLLLTPAGSGVGWTVQRVPSQCSDNVTRPDAFEVHPTAVHEVGELQETLFRREFGRAGLAVV